MSRALAALIVSLAVALSACDRMPVDAAKRVQLGLDAVDAGNYAEAYWRWRPLADLGMPEAQYQLGWLYANGNGLRVNLPTAISWWHKAAYGGLAEAEFAIGMAYLNGAKSFDPDFSEALSWLHRAGRNGNQDARELLLELLNTRTTEWLETRPSLLAESWLGEVVWITVPEAHCRADRSQKAESLADLKQGTLVRQIDTSGNWRWVVTPETDALCWIAGDQAESPAPPDH